MKDWIKIENIQEKKRLRSLKQNITELQSEAHFPEKFDFPLTMQFELTSHCNVRCKHCYNNSGIFNGKKDRMTPERWIQFAEYVVNQGGIFECILSGGEPLLLGEALFDIMDILHEDGTQFLLITNGFLLNKVTVKKLEKYRFQWIQISIDGYNSEYHDEFRNKQDSWKHAVSGAVDVVEAGLPLTIAHSVTRQNLKDIDNMCKLAYDLGAGSIILGEVNLSGRMYENSDLLLSDEERNYLYEKAEENSVRYSGKMFVRRSGLIKNQLKRYQIYPANGVIIRPNGDIRLDCMMPFVLGNVLDHDFADTWSKKGQGCWKNDRVCQYIEAYEDRENTNFLIKNHVDKDLIL